MRWSDLIVGDLVIDDTSMGSWLLVKVDYVNEIQTFISFRAMKLVHQRVVFNLIGNMTVIRR